MQHRNCAKVDGFKGSLSERDKKIMWHPFTQEKTAALPIAVKSAKGCYIYDENDNAYLDLISSWWVNLHGHGHPGIAQAIYQQALKLEHVLFAGFTHKPAVELCERLKAQLPEDLSRFFFSDNGSTSIEIALKMAYQYWFNQGITEKKIFLSFEGDYHGDTFGAMSVGAQSGFYEPFKTFLFSVLTFPFPETWQGDATYEEKEKQALTILEQHLDQHGDQIAALVVEPLVQGASGMRMCRPEFLKKVIECVQAHGILVIFDEVMTGFGRTGSLFAFEQVGIIPDFLCVSKGLTGGFLPLALTITSEKIYEAFLGDHFSKAFAHGHTYTANPLGCAAACASLTLTLDDKTQLALKTIHECHQNGLSYLSKQGSFIKYRSRGTIAAFDLPQATPEYMQSLKKHFLSEGLLIRPIGKTIYLLPPYTITSSELERTYERIGVVVKKM